MAFEWRELWCKDTVDGTVGACFGSNGGQTYLDWLITAWGWTLAVSAVGLVIALLLGSLMGVLRTTPSKPLVMLGNAWTELFRNMPLIVQLFLWYFVAPEFLPVLKSLPSWVVAAIGLGFFTSARISEQVRAGIQSIPKGQTYAGLAMGLTRVQTYRYVLLPVAFRVVIPPLTSEGMSIVKNSSVAFALSVLELTQFARQAGEETSRPTEVYAMVTVAYFISAFSVYLVASLLERAVRVPGVAGVAK
ncbi:glutamate/aspartate transport system permease protein [Inhella inkyongensis]|uniref:Glutamate/aspartate transport system permease protein n=1 Tax=Inhella inkyongensis TaxID=392593 RepID=A0A840RZJ9_9BURK|nr:amino acid ABC transporter permease [Inhella inkyongensis]MBB5203425.1 glutamate/aspartate transport system permease protein [Inhella inkyongensis]